jgi:transposase
MIAFCVKNESGRVVDEGMLAARREALAAWAKQIDRPWIGAMEATLFTGWVYDFLKPHARALKVADPQMVKAISAAKKKTDRIDARKLADLLRCNLLPECYMAPTEIRELRRLLRYRNLVVSMAVRMQNKTAGLLMEVGAEYDKKRLRGKTYFAQLLERVEVPASVVELLRLSRSQVELLRSIEKRLIGALRTHPLLKTRVERLMSIPGVGEVTALTWALEVGEVERFSSIERAISYCGLCSALRQSAGKVSRGPISKQRNRHLQTVLIEAAHLAPRWNPPLRALYERESQRGHSNRATLAVARQLVKLLLAVDRRGTPYEERGVQVAA